VAEKGEEIREGLKLPPCYSERTPSRGHKGQGEVITRFNCCFVGLWYKDPPYCGPFHCSVCFVAQLKWES
jgi:hypothetical protein